MLTCYSQSSSFLAASLLLQQRFIATTTSGVTKAFQKPRKYYNEASSSNPTTQPHSNIKRFGTQFGTKIGLIQ